MSVTRIKTALVAGIGIPECIGITNLIGRMSKSRVMPLSDWPETSVPILLSRVYQCIDRGDADFIINILNLRNVPNQLEFTLGLIDTGRPAALIFNTGFFNTAAVDTKSLASALGVPVFVRERSLHSLCAEAVRYIDSYNSYAEMCCDPSSCNIDNYVNGCRHCERFHPKVVRTEYKQAESHIGLIMRSMNLSREEAVRRILMSASADGEASVCALIHEIRRRKAEALSGHHIYNRRLTDILTGFFRSPLFTRTHI